MDKKTMEKVINGMAEKLEKYIDNTNKELKTLGIYKDDRCDNYPVIESLIKLDKKVDSLEDNIEALFRNQTAIDDDIKTLNNKISGLQWDTAQDTNKLNDRVKFLEEESKMLALNDRVNTLERTSKSLDNRCFDNIDGIKALNDKCDDLEAKNFQIKSDLDKLINGEETITLGELREAKNWEDVGKLINKGVK